MHKPELLAPAGSKESLIAAVKNGADAVHFGGSAFNTRRQVFWAFAKYEIFGQGLHPAAKVRVLKLRDVDGDRFVVVGIMDVAVTIYHPIPYPQVERMGAVFGCGVNRAARRCMPRGCWHDS